MSGSVNQKSSFTKEDLRYVGLDKFAPHPPPVRGCIPTHSLVITPLWHHSQAFFVFLLTHYFKGETQSRNVCVLQSVCIIFVISWICGCNCYQRVLYLYSLRCLLHCDCTPVYLILTSKKLHSSNQSATSCILDDDKSGFAKNR